MTDDADRQEPAGNPETQPPPQSQGSPITPPQSEIRANSNQGADGQQDTAKELAREFRWVEFAQLIINGALAVIGVIALCIYHGQLTTMQRQLGEMQSSSGQTNRLIDLYGQQVEELQAGVNESHALVVETDKSSKMTRENFTREQRPYMWVQPAAPVFKEGDVLRWGINFVNYGKAPAFKERHCLLLFTYENVVAEMTPKNRDAECAKNKGFSEGKNLSIAPPGNTMYSTAVGSVLLDADLIKRLKDADFTMGVMGVIHYEDGFGNKHRSNFCLMRFAAGGITTCENYNDVE